VTPDQILLTNDRERLVPLIVAVALFMENMDSTVISTSLPPSPRTSGRARWNSSSRITSYLAGAGDLHPGERLDGRPLRRPDHLPHRDPRLHARFDRLRVSPNPLPHFVVRRFFQGMGGAMMSPVGRLVLIRTVGRQNLVNAMSFLTMPALIGPMLGPPAGRIHHDLCDPGTGSS